jgi:hypothetical protein
MREKRPYNIDDKLLEQVIAVAYGDAGWLDRFIINRKAKKDQAVRQLLYEYKLTANSVHHLKPMQLPESVMHLVRAEINAKSENTFWSSVYIRFLSRPILSAAVAGMIIIAIISVLLLYNPQPQHKYTKAQIELAEKQFRKSIAIVGKVFNNAEKKFDEDVINNQINKSLGKGFNLVNDILIGG